jgi:transcriptional regulator with XRE-family HTH domain
MSQEDLGKAAGVSPQTIKLFETRRTAPREETLQRIREALERRGIIFSNGDKPGVKLDPEKAIIPPGTG